MMDTEHQGMDRSMDSPHATKGYELSAGRRTSGQQRNSEGVPYGNSAKSKKAKKSTSNNSSGPFSLAKEDSQPDTLASGNRLESLTLQEQRSSQEANMFSHLPLNR
jgi:hypothetical protein